MLGLIVPTLLTGCGQNAPTPTETSTTACSVQTAKHAAVAVLNPIIKRINNPETRVQGCYELDDVIKDVGSTEYDKYKPNGCNWDDDIFDETSQSPQKISVELIRPEGDKLAKVCKWAEKDAGADFQKRGAAVLQSLSPGDRVKLQQAYDGN